MDLVETVILGMRRMEMFRPISITRTKDKSFSNKHALKTHVRGIHENAYSRICDICAKVLPSKGLFIKHKLEHEGIVEPRAQCSECEKWLKNAYQLKLHMRKHTRPAINQFVCNECGKTAPSKNALRGHIRYVHKSVREYRCTFCDKAFKRPLTLKEHMATHTGDILYTCQHCSKTFNSNANLHSHRKKMHPKEWEQARKIRGMPEELLQKILSETQANNSKETEIVQNENMNIHESTVFYSNIFRNKNVLKAHKRGIHENAYSRMCDICAKVLPSGAQFIKHKLEHEGIFEPKAQCPECEKWLKNAFQLKLHMRKHTRPDVNQFVCSECGKTAPSRNALRGHIRYVHLAGRQFQCSFCDKSFKRALTLKEHMAIHTGEVLYSCPHCVKTFNSNANLHSHRKKVHPKEWEEARKTRGMPEELKKVLMEKEPNNSIEINNDINNDMNNVNIEEKVDIISASSVNFSM